MKDLPTKDDANVKGGFQLDYNQYSTLTDQQKQMYASMGLVAPTAPAGETEADQSSSGTQTTTQSNTGSYGG